MSYHDLVPFDDSLLSMPLSTQISGFVSSFLETESLLPDNKHLLLDAVIHPVDLLYILQKRPRKTSVMSSYASKLVDKHVAVSLSLSPPKVSLTSFNKLLKSEESRFDELKLLLDDACSCWACKDGYSRAYIRHLVDVHEMLADILLQVHNEVQLGRFVHDAAEKAVAGLLTNEMIQLFQFEIEQAQRSLKIQLDSD